MDNQIPDFIQSLGTPKKKEEEVVSSSPTVDVNIPDFIQKLGSNDILENQPNIKDTEVSNELGIDIDRNRELNTEEVQKYVNALTEDDYKTWKQLKNEGYSIGARKALLENQDLLYDISKPGANKYMSNRPNINSALTNMIQKSNILYEENLHPWSQSLQDLLDYGSYKLQEGLGKENIVNRYIDKNDPYNKSGRSDFATNQTLNTVELGANLAQIPNVLGQTILGLTKKGVNLIDQIINTSLLLEAKGINAINQLMGKDNRVEVNIGEDRSNLIGSYIQQVSDTLGAGFVIAYPVATYIFSMIGATNQTAEDVLQKVDGGLHSLVKRVLDFDVVENRMNANLNTQDKESLEQALVDGVYFAVMSLLSRGNKKLTNTEAYNNYITVRDMVHEYGKLNAKKSMEPNLLLKKVASQEPIGTEVLNDKGRPVAVSTTEGSEFTPYGARATLWEGTKGYAKGFYEALDSWRRNRGKQIKPRNPNEPVGELPVVEVGKPEVEAPAEPEEVKEESTENIEKGSKTKVRKAKTTTETGKTFGQGITSFIRKITDDLTGKEGGLNSELVEKLKTSKDLQNEYINTIDPYLKMNGTENPEGVIKDSLQDFIQTAKTQLETRRQNDMEFRKGQKLAGVQLSPTEKTQQNIWDTKIKNLISILNKSQDNPEVYLQYLLNLPKETINAFDKIIPDFSMNLNLIKDTLDITKAITSSDLVDKFLSYKSGFGSRKSFLKKMLYDYLKKKYRKQGVEYNMKKIEQILNNMSEEQLVELEEGINNGSLRGWTEEQISDFNEKGYDLKSWIPTKQQIEDFMNSKRYGTNKTVREYLKEKQVPLSIADPDYVRKLTMERGAKGGSLAAYETELDRILLPTILSFEGMVFHEYGHRILNQLGTRQIMDIITYISKRDNISAKAAFERRAEYFRHYMRYNNIDGKKYLVQKLGNDIYSKIEGVVQKTKEEIWDLFDIKDETELEINQIMSDVKHDTPAGQDITSRRPEPLIKEKNDYKPVREEWLRSRDPTVESISTNPYFDQQLEINFNDGKTSQKWSEYRKGLSEEQLKELDTYENDYLNQFVDETLEKQFNRGRKHGFKGEGDFDYDTLTNKKDLETIMIDEITKSVQELKKASLESREAIDVLKTIQDIYPDIIGIGEKNGKPSVKILEESFRERYEMADRPGMQQLREITMEDFFSPEEIKKLPKDLQELIKKDEN